KVVAGVRRACQGRGVSEDELARLAQQVEDELRAGGAAEIPSNEVGLAILGPLRMLDEVAYLRFASVYRSFESLDDFEAEILMLRSDGHQPIAARSSQNPPPTQTAPASQAAQTTQTTPTSQATQTGER